MGQNNNEGRATSISFLLIVCEGQAAGRTPLTFQETQILSTAIELLWTALPKPLVLLKIFVLPWGSPLHFPRLESQADSHTHTALMWAPGIGIGSSFIQQTLLPLSYLSPARPPHFFRDRIFFLSRALWLDWADWPPVPGTHLSLPPHSWDHSHMLPH